jgi:tetraacyldisaccharide 4'-kinase
MAYKNGLVSVYRPTVPVVIVGNISVGGTGKTPLTIWLALKLASYGYKPAIICGGYGGKADFWPQQVRSDSDWIVVGDEAVLIARHTKGIPVAVGPNRSDSIKALIKSHDIDIVVSDDGLQHYGLERDIEIVVIDGIRRLGNGRCLPSGPLRETAKRLKEADMTVCKGIAGRGEYPMRFTTEYLKSVNRLGVEIEISAFSEKKVHAVAGIGNPENFFSLLRSLGFELQEHVFPDHYVLSPSDLSFDDGLPVLMTEKDAIKCESFSGENIWYLPVQAELSDIFEGRLKTLLKGLISGQEIT